MTVSKTVLYGSSIGENLPEISASKSVVNISGLSHSNRMQLALSEDILSKHVLMLGGTGSGKTNAFNFFVKNIRQKITSSDVMIIFDTKGDYYNRFYQPGDYILSNSHQYDDISNKWNIFREIVADGWDNRDVLINANEISHSLFQEAIEKNTSSPFFPNAAKDLLSAILIHLIRIGKDDVSFKRDYFNNQSLRQYFDSITPEKIIKLLSNAGDMASVLSYIGNGTSDQALGVIAEMQSIVRNIFIGSFAEKGMFSLREFVKNKGGRVLFIEYDLSIGSVLTPIYRLFFDLALKEALGRNKSEGNVYLFCDEFKLLPHLQHIDDGVNFGRSLGVKIFAGLQSIEQLYEIYGENKGRNIAAGFSTLFAFRANDLSTRNFVTGLYGKNLILEQFSLSNRDYTEEKREGNTVEDWDLSSLKLGEAIIGLPFSKPFIFQLDECR